MSPQPSVIIIARHGARLDQADKEWQTNNSERSWDTPLSYGGWIQSQNLGARVATELDVLDLLSNSELQGRDVLSTDPRPQKRRKVTIHSSPYLRCLQTSTGIAAGMQYPLEAPRVRPFPTPRERSALAQPPMNQNSPASPTNKNPESIPAQLAPRPNLPTLKVDAFLGEWLSEGYYAKSGPPPHSTVLVKAAKENLQRPPEEIKGAELVPPPQLFNDYGWAEKEGEDKENENSNVPERDSTDQPQKFPSIRTLPKRSRTISFANDIANDLPELRHHRRARTSTYSPPVPTYSIAPQDAIPIGFVNHARDACLKTDLEWDSQSPPLNWGDGGQYEEEWSTMHRRFRNGLQQMLTYYETQVTLTQGDTSDAEEDEDHVLILVTHQAGCNALIRLITNAPALHDVGTASLTMAVRKPTTKDRKVSAIPSTSPDRHRRRGSLDLGLAEEYDMRIIASTEHLRGGSNPLGLNSPRLGRSPAFASRRLVGAESMEGFSIGDPLGWRSSSVSRPGGTRSHAADVSPVITPTSGSGLWSSRPTRNNSSSSALDGVDPKSSTTTVGNSTIHEEDETWLPDGTIESPVTVTTTSAWEPLSFGSLPVRRISQQPSPGNNAGLWGSGSNHSDDSSAGGLWPTPSRNSFNGGAIRRDRSPGKRRWTAVAASPS